MNPEDKILTKLSKKELKEVKKILKRKIDSVLETVKSPKEVAEQVGKIKKIMKSTKAMKKLLKDEKRRLKLAKTKKKLIHKKKAENLENVNKQDKISSLNTKTKVKASPVAAPKMLAESTP